MKASITGSTGDTHAIPEYPREWHPLISFLGGVKLILRFVLSFISLYGAYVTLGPSLCQSWFNKHDSSCLLVDLWSEAVHIARAYVLPVVTSTGTDVSDSFFKISYSSDLETLYVFGSMSCEWTRYDPVPVLGGVCLETNGRIAALGCGIKPLTVPSDWTQPDICADWSGWLTLNVF